MRAVPRIVRFIGGVSCRREQGLLGLTLIGRTDDRPDELVTLAFPATAPADLPEVLEDPVVERFDADQIRITSGEREWLVAARTWHLHREVASLFYRALAPRAVPWRKRLFWRLVLALLANPLSKRLLLMLRRR